MTLIMMTNEDDTGSGSGDCDQQKVGECDEVDDVVDMVMRGQRKRKRKKERRR